MCSSDLAIALSAAIDYVQAIGIDAIHAHETALVGQARDALLGLNSVRVFGPQDSAGILSFEVEGVHPHDVGTILDESGVAIRAGHHCAQPLLTWLGVENLACCRASVAFYNDKADIDKFIAGLHHVWSTFNG